MNHRLVRERISCGDARNKGKPALVSERKPARATPKMTQYLAVFSGIERGSVELAIAAFIAALLLFAKYYLLPVHPLVRAIAVGFAL
jgi:hypothetical protein